VGFRADLVFAEAMAVFAMSPREGFVLFRYLLPRITRPSFRTQAPLFPAIVGRSRNRSKTQVIELSKERNTARSLR
jgi:hypothetical protein